MTDKTPEEILRQYTQYPIKSVLFGSEKILPAMKEYGDLQWNAALEWAAENAKIIEDWHRGRLHGTYIDKQSILSGKR